jgi:hypothetical protein
MEDKLEFQYFYFDPSKDRSALLFFVNEGIGYGVWFETFAVL